MDAAVLAQAHPDRPLSSGRVRSAVPRSAPRRAVNSPRLAHTVYKWSVGGRATSGVCQGLRMSTATRGVVCGAAAGGACSCSEYWAVGGVRRCGRVE